MRAECFSEIKKYNPYHGKDGRFTTASGSNTVVSSSGRGGSDSSASSTGVKDFGFDKNDGTKCASNLTHPKKISSVERGEPMNFEEADTNKVNPNFERDIRYQTNCQTCVVAYELRRRGYNVEAKLRSGFDYDQEKLARNSTHVWKDPKTGGKPSLIQSPETFASSGGVGVYLDNTLEEGKRYTMKFSWANDGGSHIIIAEKTKGRAWLYDPQSGKSYVYADEIESYTRKFAGVGKNKRNTGMSGGAIQMLPISDMDIDEFAVETILTKSTT